MSDPAAFEQDFLAARSAQPAARGPSTFGEVWTSSWDKTGLDTMSGIGAPYQAAYEDLTRAVESRIGKPVHEALRDKGIGLGTAVTREARTQLVTGLVADLPEDQRKALEPLLDVRKRAAEKAGKTEREASDIYETTFGLSANAVRFAAGAARQAVDPVNIATMPAGGGLTGPVFKMLGREFLIGAATQAIQEPRIQSGRAELELEAGWGHAAENILEAGIGNAGFAGLLRTGAAVIRAGRNAVRGRAEAPAAPAEPTPLLLEYRPVESPDGPAGPSARVPDDIGPEDLEAVARVVERDTAIDVQMPARTPDAEVAHASGLQEAADALEAGRPFDPEKAVLIETRGQGRQFHGTSAVDLEPSSEHYSTKNYYGQGFYTTDAADIAHGYSKRGSASTGERNIFTVEEKRPLKIYDGEAPIDADVLAKITPDPKSHSSFDDIVNLALEEKPKNLRELYDNIRDIGTGFEHSADDIQEIFDGINYSLREAGYDGMSHNGGLRTNKSAHRVVIYFEPEASITVRKDNFNNFAQPKAPPALSDLPLPDRYRLERDAAAPPTKEGTTVYQITDAQSGEKIGSARITVSGNTAIIESINAVDGANALGPSATRSLLRQFQREHPEVEHLVGDRVSGARAAAGVSADDSVISVKATTKPAGGEAKPGAEAPAPKPLGDPVLARDADRVLEDLGDFEVTLKNPDGTFRKVSARDALRQIDDDGAAARELADCIGGAAV